MKVEDYYVQKRRGWVRLHEKGGKVTEMPCHHNLEQYLEEWLAAAGLAAKPEVPLFPTLRHGRLADGTLSPLPQANVNLMIQKRAKVAQLRTKISAHSFRATGITTYLQNGGKLEVDQAMAGHESARTTSLYESKVQFQPHDANKFIVVDIADRLRGGGRRSFGISTIGAGAAITSGLNLLTTSGKFTGSTPGTSIASYSLSKLLPGAVGIGRKWAPTLMNPFAESAVAGRVLGRWVPIVGELIIAKQVSDFGDCALANTWWTKPLF